MLEVFGRINSINVIKVLWLLDELGMPYTRQDAGMAFGRVDDPDYRAMNPNGRIPTIRHGDVVLWESNSVLRYLAMIGGERGLALYPADPAKRASADRWMDWQLSTLGPAERNLFWGVVRTPPEKRDPAAIATAVTASAACWQILDARIAAGGPYIDGATMTIADIVLGAYARRWFGPEVAQPGMPELPALARWYARLGERPGFQRWVAPKLH
ncbi:MAG TPA: glutathione S-transferase [Roseomonas sp.]|jgi:glutathione S-transferase